eukprot:Amastigsp_a7526_15.p3 type:complete len:134 gc:universal Amastigsp_a7526_15:607-206(-)
MARVSPQSRPHLFLTLPVARHVLRPQPLLVRVGDDDNDKASEERRKRRVVDLHDERLVAVRVDEPERNAENPRVEPLKEQVSEQSSPRAQHEVVVLARGSRDADNKVDEQTQSPHKHSKKHRLRAIRVPAVHS